MRNLVAPFLMFFVACGPSDRDGPELPTDRIEVTPENLDITIVDGTVIAQPYTATRVDVDGNRFDITDRVRFELESTAFGTWDASTLTITGGGAGLTRVLAFDTDVSGASGDTNLIVRVKQTRFDGPAPADVVGMFDDAVVGLGRAPSIMYPTDSILVPPNLGEMDVHWRDTGGNNLFEISLRSQYVEIVVYKQAIGEAFTTFTHAEWSTVASPREQVTVSIHSLATSDPTMKFAASPRHIDVTNETVQGGLYYWATQPTQGIYRYDMATPDVAPVPFFAPGAQPTPCIGCHALSKDGSKLALTLDQGNGRGTIVDVATGNVLVPYDSDPQYWNFATFTPGSDKLVTVYQGAMVLRSAAGGAVLASVPNTPGMFATHPELSPDGTLLANVETTNDYYDFQVPDGGIVTRTYDAATDTFGPIQTLVTNAPGAAAFYPSWSPDGQWLLFTRTTGNSYSDQSAQTWVVKADGSQPPIHLQAADMAANQMNSWPRWAPFPQTFGPDNQPLYYITFSTVRAFGIRPKTGTQIWMAPFFPERAAVGEDPSGPAFRMPFQRIDTSNHIAQWTQAVVVVQ